jgi:tetratricopeptide (TPR) repeat protein
MVQSHTGQAALSMQQVQRIFKLFSSGQLEAARDAAAGLLEEYPREPLLLTLFGTVLTALGEYDEAVTRIREAVAIRPDAPGGYFQLANALFEQGDLEAAVNSYRRTTELEPGNLDAHNKLCQTLERSNRLDEAAVALEKAKQQLGGTAALALREAELLKRNGDTHEARSCLEASDWRNADPDTLEAAAYLLVELSDRGGDTDVAFAYAQEANRAAAAGWASQRLDRSTYFRLADEMEEVFTAGNIADWVDVEIEDQRPAPVFLLGFPRSGTTLLNTILHSHCAVTALEERPTVYRLEKELREMTGPSLENIGSLVAGQVASLRNSYFDEVERHAGPQGPGTVIVDKMPLNLVQAGLIHRIFPDARFIFVLRHPCDSVLSCYLRPLRLNEATVNFLDLGNASQLYDRVMGLWHSYLELLPIRAHTLRYESLVSDLEGTVLPCLEFLGLGWDDGVRNYTKTARQESRIVTPSYDQVTRELYSDASGRWQGYREHLQPVLPVLLPWAERLGYGE